ncbi:MAG TPA: PAS domain S-box protein [Terriglobales bacterium]|nr:PAS domain S-box protein [Terriglobales bacterium]
MQKKSPHAGRRGELPPPSPNLSEDILNVIQAMVLVANGDGQIVYASPSVERILGYTPAEVLGDSYWELPLTNDAEARARHHVEIMRIARGELPPQSVPYPTPLISKSGEERWILWHDAKGPGDLIIGAGQDITELRRTEQALEQSAKEFRAVFESSSDGLLITDSGWMYVEVNHAAEKIFGIPRADIIGKVQGTLLTSSVNVEQFRATAIQGGQYSVETEFRCPDGKTRHIGLSLVPNFRDAHHLFIMRDLTERRELELQLMQAQKLEAVGRLAGGVAHDFNNMLTAIRGYAELLLRNSPEGKERRYVEGIMGAATRAAETTSQLLAFSRRQVLQPKVLSISDTVLKTIDLLNRIMREDIRLITILDPDAGNIMVDPGQFSQILMNLAVNARDAMPNGGKLIIETHAVYLDDDYARTHVQVSPGWYSLLAVTDTGTGIAAEVRDHIFEPFFTTKPQGEGSGLGLSTVYGIVKQSRGFIWVYSEPGEGSTFKIYLPMTSPEGQSAQKLGAAPHKLLVIEDDDVIRSLVVTVLREQGHTVLEAADGEQALAACQSFEGIIDLVITDVTAPRLSGEDLMGFFAVRYPKVKIIHISGFPREHLTNSHSVPLEAHFLAKPFSMKQLLAKVEEALKGGQESGPRE